MRETHCRKIIMALFAGFAVLIALQTGDAFGSDEKQRLGAQERFAKIPTITAEQAYAMFKQGKLILVDASGSSRYRLGHAFGSINIPVPVAKKNIKLKFPKSILIAVYCM